MSGEDDSCVDSVRDSRASWLNPPQAADLASLLSLRSIPGVRGRCCGTFGTGICSDTVMICQQCHEREAIVHITELTDHAERKTDLCEACCRESRPEVLEPPMEQEGYDATILPLGDHGSQGPETK
jgi:hypothetical protein